MSGSPSARRREAAFVFLGSLTVAIALGCGGESAAKRSMQTSAPEGVAFRMVAGEKAKDGVAFAMPEGSKPLTAAGAAAPAAPVIDTRKIIHTANTGLVVRDFAKAEKEIGPIVRKHKGFVADAQVQRRQGAAQSAEWTLRVPAEQFELCLESIAALGMVESQKIGTQDVTEEFVDVAARIASQKEVEKRLIAMLATRNGDLREVIELEQKLGAVRGEIERMQGRMNVLAGRVALSTIQLSVREQHDYVPAQKPTFVTRVGDAWDRSLASLTEFGTTVTVFAVAWAPWLPLLAVGLLTAGFLWRRIPWHADLTAWKDPPRPASRQTEKHPDEPAPPAG